MNVPFAGGGQLLWVRYITGTRCPLQTGCSTDGSAGSGRGHCKYLLCVYRDNLHSAAFLHTIVPFKNDSTIPERNAAPRRLLGASRCRDMNPSHLSLHSSL